MNSKIRPFFPIETRGKRGMQNVCVAAVSKIAPTSDLIDEAIVHARIDAGAQSGPDYQQAFARRYTAAVNQLPWAVVQETIKQTKGAAETVTASFASGFVNSDLQPMVDESGTLDNQGAWELLFWRRVVTYTL